MVSDEATLSVRKLSAHVGEVTILEGASFEAAAGEITTLFGPSGAGKTTIVSAIMGINQPGIETEGDVLFDGEPSRAGVQLGYLPQDAPATLNPARRIGTALGELVDLHYRPPAARSQRAPWRRAHIARILGMAAFDIADDELEDALRKYPFEFSGGQRTRLALAQVLATDPAVLVLDEPTVGLDAINRANLVDRLDALRRSGIAIILITHDPLIADRLSDHTLYVRGGRLVDKVDHPLILPPPTQPGYTHATERALELRDISVSQHRTPILRGINLELSAGEGLGIIGVSGAGKSTIACCIAGLTVPNHGSVRVAGEPAPALRKRTKRQLAHVQYIWQESASSFEPRRLVVDQVAATAMRLRGHSAADARSGAVELLCALDIAEQQAFRYPPGLSGGQLQRAAVARALIARPGVLICDEVTTGLDRPLSRQILDYVDAYRRDSGAAVISISHDVTTQLERADRIAIVDHGQIVETGTPDKLVAAPETAILRQLLAADEIDGT